MQKLEFYNLQKFYQSDLFYLYIFKILIFNELQDYLKFMIIWDFLAGNIDIQNKS